MGFDGNTSQCSFTTAEAQLKTKAHQLSGSLLSKGIIHDSTVEFSVQAISTHVRTSGKICSFSVQLLCPQQ